MYTLLADHLQTLASEVERVIKAEANGDPGSFQERGNRRDRATTVGAID